MTKLWVMIHRQSTAMPAPLMFPQERRALAAMGERSRLARTHKSMGIL